MFGEGREGGMPPQCAFVVSGHIIMKFYSGVDHQSDNSNIERDFQKSNDIIMLRPLLLCRKYTKMHVGLFPLSMIVS